jgi:hypothetical protein
LTGGDVAGPGVVVVVSVVGVVVEVVGVVVEVVGLQCGLRGGHLLPDELAA